MRDIPRPRSTWDPAALRLLARSCLIAVALILVVLVFFVVGPAIPHSFAFDGRAYWGFPRDPLYAGPGTANGYGIYRYSPVFVPLMTGFSLLPWPAFAVLWVGFLTAVYVWMVGPGWLALLAFPPFLYEIYMGNVHLLLAAAIVLGFRYPAAWSFVLLTKVTPGIGLLWFAVRREWRALGVALGITAILAGAGFLVAPGAWRDWLRSLADTAPSIGPNVIVVPLLFRLVAAAALIVWGARADRRWTVVVGSMLALPTLWMHSLAMLAGVVALHRGLPETAATSGAWLLGRLPARLRPAGSENL